MKKYRPMFFVYIFIVSFSVADALTIHDFKMVKGVEWVRVGNIQLTMDIYIPTTRKSRYPVLVIYHGGGWLINSNAIMNEASQYIARHGEYIICNVNYRLLGDNNNMVTMNQIVEDAFGAILWIKEHINEYGGDPLQIGVTGDSAGGQLAAMIVLCGTNLESDGFAGNSLGFCPTYLPKGMTAERAAQNNLLAVQAAIFSYGAFDLYASCSKGFESPANIFWMMAKRSSRGIFGDSISIRNNPAMYRAVSPKYQIQNAHQRTLPPMLCTVGSIDLVVSPSSVKEFVSALKDSGHAVQYWEYEGRNHAFLDSGSKPFLGVSFEKDAPAALERMIQFFDSVFYRQ